MEIWVSIRFYPSSNFWPEGYCCLYCLSIHPIHLSKSCPDKFPQTIHDKCFIFSRKIKLTWNLCTERLFWPFDLNSEIVVFGPLLEYYRWQLLQVSRANQFDMWPMHCGGYFDISVLTWTSTWQSCPHIALLGNYTFLIHHIFQAHPPKIAPVDCRVMLPFLTFVLDIITLVLYTDIYSHYWDQKIIFHSISPVLNLLSIDKHVI